MSGSLSLFLYGFRPRTGTALSFPFHLFLSPPCLLFTVIRYKYSETLRCLPENAYDAFSRVASQFACLVLWMSSWPLARSITKALEFRNKNAFTNKLIFSSRFRAS